MIAEQEVKPIRTGAERVEAYLPILEDKTVGLIVNQTSRVGDTHLVDYLLDRDIQIKAVFAPEHGFRGEADAGEELKSGIDTRTGLPLVSLYGKKRKPAPADLAGIDYVIFDIQDVGARFYTYISTMHYAMEACAENDVNFIVFDRPNPNGHYVDGPLLKPAYRSFVGMHPVPVVHGMTVGEYAQMINGEGWLKNGVQCNLQVIECENYDHNVFYELPVRPSPNLPNMRSIYLYPSTCFFEGTTASEGRGTDKPFQVYGHPDYPGGSYEFTPRSMDGAKNPKHKGKRCKGYDLTTIPIEEIRTKRQIELDYLIDFYRNFPDKDEFFRESLYIDKLAGTSDLRKAIVAGESAASIRATWRPELEAFRQLRKQYLLYEDFDH